MEDMYESRLTKSKMKHITVSALFGLDKKEKTL